MNFFSPNSPSLMAADPAKRYDITKKPILGEQESLAPPMAQVSGE